jgi:hypothetical protein
VDAYTQISPTARAARRGMGDRLVPDVVVAADRGTRLIAVVGGQEPTVPGPHGREVHGDGGHPSASGTAMRVVEPSGDPRHRAHDGRARPVRRRAPRPALLRWIASYVSPGWSAFAAQSTSVRFGVTVERPFEVLVHRREVPVVRLDLSPRRPRDVLGLHLSQRHPVHVLHARRSSASRSSSRCCDRTARDPSTGSCSRPRRSRGRRTRTGRTPSELAPEATLELSRRTPRVPRRS